MSAKLPVGATINEAFQFGIHRWSAAIRFAWIPVTAALVIAGVYAAAIANPAAIAAAQAGGDAVSFREMFRAPIAVVVAGGLVVYGIFMLLMAGVMASVFRLVALGEERPGLFHLRLDGPAVRVFWAYFIIGLLGAVIWGVCLLAGWAMSGQSPMAAVKAFSSMMAFSMQAGQGAEPPAALVREMTAGFAPVGYALLLALIPTVYLNVKLAPFPAASAAENRLVLFGSLAMTRGHFWSIVGVYLLFIAAMVILSVIFQLAASILSLLGELAAGQGGALALVGLIIGVGFTIVSVIFQAFAFSVQYSIPAIIYRRLSADQQGPARAG